MFVFSFFIRYCILLYSKGVSTQAKKHLTLWMSARASISADSIWITVLNEWMNGMKVNLSAV